MAFFIYLDKFAADIVSSKLMEKEKTKKFYQLDTTRICNLRCFFCYKAGEEEKDFKSISSFMNLDDIKKIINEETNACGVSLVNNGEFFLNPDWRVIAQHVFSTQSKHQNLGIITLNTNGTLLDEEKADILINEVLNYRTPFNIVFSLNASGSDSYKNITGKDLFDNTVKNIKSFIKKVSSQKELRYLLTVSVQCLVFPQNSNDIYKFVKYWDDFYKELKIDHEIIEDNFCSEKQFLIALRRVLMKGIDGNRLFLDKIEELSRDFDIKISNENIEFAADYNKRKACKYLFKYPAIKGNKVSICCRDTFMRHVYKEKDEKENDQERYFKISHILGEFENISLCRACENYEAMTQKEVEEYLLSYKDSSLSIGNNVLLTLNQRDLKGKRLLKMYKHRLKTGFSYDIYNETSLDQFVSRDEDLGSLTRIKEMDFCVGWTRYIFDVQGNLKAGCEAHIGIKDLDEYMKAIRQYDLSKLPERCVYCEKKFSHQPMRDRKYTYPHGRRTAFIVNNINILKHQKYLEFVSLKEYERAIDIIDELKSNQIVREFLENNYDSEKLCDIVSSTEDVFLISEYALFTKSKKNLKTSFEKLINLGTKRFPFPKLLIKVMEEDIGLFLENVDGLKPTLEFMQKSVAYKTVIESCLLNLFKKDKRNIQRLSAHIDHDIFLDTLKFFLLDSLDKKRLSLAEYFELVETYLKDNIDRSRFITPTAIGFLRAKRYHSLYKFIIKYSEVIMDDLLKDLTEIDFKDYTFRHIHFLIALSMNDKFKKDRLNHLVFSWYMKKELFNKARCFFEKIEEKRTFWDDDTLKKTKEFLENPKTSIRSRIFGILKGR